MPMWPRWSNAQGLTARLQSLHACSVARPALTIRRLQPHDGPLLREFVRNLSAASRQARFHAVLQDLSPSLLERLVRRDPREYALIATHCVEGREVAIAEARYAFDDDEAPDAREFAVTVADDRRRRGVASALLAALAVHAARAGVRLLYGDLMRDNLPMLRLARKLGFSVRMHPGDARLQRVELRFEAMADDDMAVPFDHRATQLQLKSAGRDGAAMAAALNGLTSTGNEN
jgi:acetyltransferase